MSDGADRTYESAKEGMVCGQNSGGPKITRVLLDVDTQRDFMYPHGAEYFVKAGRIAPRIAQLFSCARQKGYLVISTMMSLRVAGLNGENGCVEGTKGQKKPAYTLLPKRICFDPSFDTDLPMGVLRKYQQVIFEKRTLDPFSNPKFDRLLSSLQVSEYVVFGLITEEAVKRTVLGLLTRGKQVRLVVDAIAGQNDAASQMAMRQMLAKGARITTTGELAPQIHQQPAVSPVADRFAALQPFSDEQPTGRWNQGDQLADGNGNGNGKKSKAHGRNGNGHNDRGAKAHGGNGNGNGKKPAIPRRRRAIHHAVLASPASGPTHAKQISA